MKEKDIIKIFKALSVSSRLKIITLIKDKKLCVNAITNQLDITQPAVSQHLAILKDAGLVKSDRYGSIIHYEMNTNRFQDFKESVKNLLGEEFILASLISTYLLTYNHTLT